MCFVFPIRHAEHLAACVNQLSYYLMVFTSPKSADLFAGNLPVRALQARRPSSCLGGIEKTQRGLTGLGVLRGGGELVPSSCW